MLVSAPVEELLRLLDLVRRELGAVDVRAELGGRAPDDPHTLFTELVPGWRVVARFDEAPTRDMAEKLDALVAPFEEVAGRIEIPRVGLAAAKQRELDEQLDALAERTGARAALVFDERSPVLWGCSAPRATAWDLDAMERARLLAKDVAAKGLDPARWLAEGRVPSEDTLREAGVDETVAQRWGHRFNRLAGVAPSWGRAEWQEALQIATAVGAARAQCRGGQAPDRVAEHADAWGVFARGFAQIYLLALVYDGAYSELHAEGPAVRALPHIETLVLALPPVDPPPRSAKVIPLRRG